MPDAVTVVISAAGLGSRLGLNMPKALVPVGGRPVLEHQLSALPTEVEVVVVAGFRAQDVVDLVRLHRPDAVVCLNHDFASTGTAASLSRGAAVARDWVVSLDGDLLVDRDDLLAFIERPGPALGLVPTTSNSPVCARTGPSLEVTGLSQDDRTEWEWCGLVKAPRALAAGLGRGHVFSGLVAHLPIAGHRVSCVEIDEIDDLDLAEAWLAARVDQ